jgi:phage portal protein BeeE
MDKQTSNEANQSRDSEQQSDEFCNFRLVNFVLNNEREFRIECNRVLLES